MEVFSGVAKFTTPRPFESNSAEVVLSYTIAPGEDPEAVAAVVGQMAKRQAQAMIGVTHMPVGHNDDAERLSLQDKRNLVVAAIAAQAKVPVPEVAPVKPVVVIGETKPEWTPSVGQPIGDAMGLTPANPTVPAPATPTAGVAAPQTTSPSTATIASPSEIKDADLHTAAAHAVTRLAPAHGEMASIKVTALIGEYTNPPSMRAIPQHQRQEFITKLDALS